jgi:hypothetical protein
MAFSPNHQTIRLSAGRHRGPDHGACVMELASMLTGGPFSDHPPSVCPVIAAFLRSYNDHLNDERRQDLYCYAARVAGTRAKADTERRRSKMCLAWARACCHRPLVAACSPYEKASRLRLWLGAGRFARPAGWLLFVSVVGALSRHGEPAGGCLARDCWWHAELR